MSTKAEMKTIRTTGAEVKFDMDGAQGEFVAAFATLDVIDKDGDVILAGALGDQADGMIGQKVKIASWGHKWDQLPTGRGEIYEQDGRLYVQGKFFLDTPHGLAEYQTVKALGELCEWSFGFHIEAAEPGMVDNRPVRFIKRVRVFEVSPVLEGAGVNTETVSIKGCCPTCGSADSTPLETTKAPVDEEPPAEDPPSDEPAEDDPSLIVVCGACGSTECPCAMEALHTLIRYEATRHNLRDA